MQKFITTSAQETQHLAETFAKKLSGGTIVLLYGDLGAGKTTFTQGLAKGLGVEKRIISPTFVIIRTYVVRNRESKFFYHVDLYRLEKESEIEGTGLLDIIKQENAIVVIEWPEKLGSYLPKKRWEVKFTPLGEDKREITVEKL